MERDDILKTVSEILGPAGRMIAGSKSWYYKTYPMNIPVFNANICIASGKIWFGDIDLTFDKTKLMQIANTIGESVYVLRESDGRFENEDNPKLNNAIAVIHTNNTIVVDSYIQSAIMDGCCTL